MKAALSIALALAVVCALALTGISAEKAEKEVELKGTITCAKCDLKEADSCKTVIKVKEKDKDVIYFFDSASHKDNHSKICKEGKEGVVKGVVTEKDGKKEIKVSSIKFN